MTPEELIFSTQRDGVFLEVTDAGKLRIFGDETAAGNWLETIKAHRDGIILALKPDAPSCDPAASCKTCTHLAKPGKSDGYCAERYDLPNAYGKGHPLHKLPKDGGRSCREWVSFRRELADTREDAR